MELLMNVIHLEKELGNKDFCGVNLGFIHSQAMLIYSFSEAANLYPFQVDLVYSHKLNKCSELRFGKELSHTRQQTELWLFITKKKTQECL